MTRFARAWLAAIGACGVVASVSGQGFVPGATHRVFLRDGQAVPSLGEAVIVDGRVVFTLLVSGTAGRSELQLMSLPASSVDVDRTNRYAESMRAALYAATRGEADYAAVTEEVQRALEHLKGVEDPRKRLELAEEARRRLITWSEGHFRYRAGDIRELLSLFDEVIAELRVAAGETQVSIDLRSGPADPVHERIVAAPPLRESIALALSAARAADVSEDRMAVLRSLTRLLDREGTAEDVRITVSEELKAELAAEGAYVSLSSDAIAAADTAMKKGDVEGVSAVRATVLARDRALGERRPQQIAALLATLEAKLEATRTHRLALEHYAYVRRDLFAYEQRIRPALSTLEGLKSVIVFIRDMKSMAFERLERANKRLQWLATDLATIKPPPDLAQVHGTLVSAVHMAVQAAARRRLAVVAIDMNLAREASTAAAGAELLILQSRELLVKSLFPPKFDDR